MILADKYERYDLTYEGCHVFNPGSFVGNSFEWSVYYPATGRSESRWVLASVYERRTVLIASFTPFAVHCPKTSKNPFPPLHRIARGPQPREGRQSFCMPSSCIYHSHGASPRYIA